MAGTRDRLADPEVRDWLRGLGIAVAAGLFMAFTGPFNTGLAPLPQRLIYWLGLMVGGSIGGRLITTRILSAAWLEQRPWLGGLAASVVIALPLVGLVWAATSWIFDRPLRVADLPSFIGPVFLVSVAMTAISLMADRRPRETHAGGKDAAPPRFLERLPLKLRGAEIYAVEAEDHYLRIHTDRGSDLILLRLGDAVGELEGIEGAQTHRSWWVAKAAVVEADRGDGRATFTLKNGVKAPVSRTYARVLRAEGWY